MKIYDLTHTISCDMPVYPGTEQPSLKDACSYERDGFRETLITMFSHTGTHIDAPAHLYDGGKTLDAFPAEQFFGRALVVDCRAIPSGELITLASLAQYGDRVADADFLLFCLGWDKYWGKREYFEGFPCIDGEVLSLIINGNYKGIGFDAISLDPVSDTALERHNKLFAAKEIINIENLRGLSEICGKTVNFASFPLKTENADGAPARAIAWED